jgi:hypothetical protein
MEVIMPNALRFSSGTAIACLVLGSSAALAAEPNWSEVPSHTLTLFYPGQSSYEWLRSPEHRRADRQVQQGEACVECHEGEQAEIGQLIVSGERLEPDPIEGKVGSIEVQAQAAYDEQNLYMRFQWPTQLDRPGRYHEFKRYDGEKWASYGGHRASPAVKSGEQPPLYEDRLAIMLDDGSVEHFATQGCWVTCHTGMRDMPEEPTAEETAAHPLLGQQGQGRSDIRKYLPASRIDPAAPAWDATKPAEEIARLKELGQFLELMQWRAHRSGAVDMADDGYVLEYRLFDEGKNPFGSNIDSETQAPKFMFDEAKAGSRSLSESDIADLSKPYALIREENAAPYDPNAGWQEGDILPGLIVSREDATGSAADNDSVIGSWEDGVWTVTWTRALETGNADDKALTEGQTYNVGVAVHDDNVTTRFHFVSFPFTLGIGTEADIEAVRAE